MRGLRWLQRVDLCLVGALLSRSNRPASHWYVHVRTYTFSARWWYISLLLHWRLRLSVSLTLVVASGVYAFPDEARLRQCVGGSAVEQLPCMGEGDERDHRLKERLVLCSRLGGTFTWHRPLHATDVITTIPFSFRFESPPSSPPRRRPPCYGLASRYHVCGVLHLNTAAPSQPCPTQPDPLHRQQTKVFKSSTQSVLRQRTRRADSRSNTTASGRYYIIFTGKSK
jgi:hypothetical protein